MARRIVTLTTSYPRFPGDGVGTFIEPISKGVAAHGYEVHLLAPWHPLVERRAQEGGLHFHFFRYAPTARLHVFGYASALRADVSLRGSAYLAAPLAVGAGCWALHRLLRTTNAALVHAHWAVPGGFMAALGRLGIPVPLLVSLHGSDVYLAEVNRAVQLGADPDRMTVVPYGVDTDRFRPDATVRASLREQQQLAQDDPVLVIAGRLVRKKGFEYLFDALPRLTGRFPRLVLVVAGGGDLEPELRRRATDRGVLDHVRFLGAVKQGEVARWLAAADLAVVPSVKDDSGNVDGLPNVLLEALASGTAVIATAAGGMGTVAKEGQTARVVHERDPDGLANAVSQLLLQPATARELGQRARAEMCRTHSWERTAERFEDAYACAFRRAQRTPDHV
jgi:glycosyltransferase involved in cell wall biosynthesis